MGRKKAQPVKSTSSAENWCSTSSFSIQHEVEGIEPSVQQKQVSTFSYLNIKKNANYLLGEILVGRTNNVFPNEWSKCKVEFTPDDTQVLIHFNNVDPSLVIVKTANNTLIKNLFRNKWKIFAFDFQLIDGQVFCKVHFDQLPLKRFDSAIGSTVKTLFCILFQLKVEHIENKEIGAIGAKEVKTLYDSLNERQINIELPDQCVQHDCLKPILRDYQIRSVRWMLSREKKRKITESLHPLYQIVTLPQGETVYFDKYTGYVTNEKPLTSSLRTGGILADEMGLGKTVEVLACILSNPKSKEKLEHQRDVAVTIESQRKKREMEIDSSQALYVDKPKRLKLNEHPKGKKSAAKIAAELWYNRTLQSVAAKATSSSSTPSKSVRTHCVCGSTSDKGTVMCVDCNKYQHMTCIGYERQFGTYRCTQCWKLQPLIDSGGTLIVCPHSLRNQWKSEIGRHVKGQLSVLLYDGPTYMPVYPTNLADYDIVLTTYSVLHAEFRLMEARESLKLRQQQRYLSPGSPLTRIRWWRLCLDEAQVVEIPSRMISEMARSIEAVHRWAVTGTPISRNINDLHGLIDYLQLQPYCDENAWNHLLQLPYLHGQKQPMLDFLSKIMWRTQKSTIFEQIGIPEQTINSYTLEFSPVENFYYKREHQLCAESILTILNSYDLNLALKNLDRSDLKKLLRPLLTLRQACSHPNAARGRYLATSKKLKTMKDLLEALIDKNKLECEEHLRAIIAASNGIAGIHLLIDAPISAVEKYREVLQIAARFNAMDDNPILSVDKLQLIHAVYNLSEILHTTAVPPTLRDDSLTDYLSTLETKYMDKHILESCKSFRDSKALTEEVADLQEKLVLNQEQWFSDLLDWITINDLLDDVSDRIQHSLEVANLNSLNLSNVCKSAQRLSYFLITWNTDIIEYRDEFLQMLPELYEYERDSSEKIRMKGGIVEAARNCHLRPQKNDKDKRLCSICTINNHMKKYEAVLFNTTTNEDNSNKGNWQSSAAEVILKGFLSFARAKHVDANIIHDGRLHLQIIDYMRREFKELRKFWTFLDQQTCAQDEIDICKTRMRIKETTKADKKSKTDLQLQKLSNALDNKFETIHMLDQHELAYQKSLLMVDECNARTQLERLLGTLKYLETLNNQNIAGRSPDPCPICKNPLEVQWSIFPCGHSFCIECLAHLVEKTINRKVPCSVCRQLHAPEEVNYIRTDGNGPVDETTHIKGNFSTKIQAITKLIIDLKEKEPNVKILVFSMWADIIQVVKSALFLNQISCELLHSSNAKVALEKFKDPEKQVTALLLPINLGSKGLNLIEATHVILVEPLISPADELQAIGRVHRIGQTKPTFIHKFVIKDTIEEKISEAVSSNVDVWDDNKVTLRQLKELFLEDCVDEPMEVD